MRESDAPSVGRRAKSIGRVQLEFDGDWNHGGTCFAVAKRHVLTAMHVVAERDSGERRSEKIRVQLDGKTYDVASIARSDATYDWALLELDRDVDVPAIPTSALRSDATQFSTWGFPTFNENGATFVGGIVNRAYEIAGSTIYELKAESANNVPTKGLSGAPCVVNGVAVGVMCAAHMKGFPTTPHVIGGALFATPMTNILAACGELIPRLPEFPDLPPLPERPLPDDPFLYLNAYGEEHAELYFGRNAKIYELYRAITATDGSPLVLLAGASGVGKTSLLRAGLAPRLAASWTVRLVRPDATRLPTTVGAFEGSEAKPLLVILDQLEERFGAVGEEKAGNELVEVLTALQGAKHCKLLLGFREEAYAAITRVLLERFVGGPTATRIDLQRMGKDDVVEALTGIGRTPRLHAKYNFTIDDALAHEIAADLVDDPKTPVAPSLQVLLTKLYRAAKLNNGVVTKELYTNESRTGYLDAFLAERLQAAKKQFSAQTTSGLVHDVLEFHIERPARALIRTAAERREAYGDRAERIVEWLTREGRLLITIGNGDTRLVHDTLVPLVRDAGMISQRPGQRARRLIDIHLQANREPNAEDWKVLRPGLSSTHVLPGRERKFVEACESASRRRSFKRSGIAIGVAAVTLGLGILALVLFLSGDKAATAERLARAEEMFITSHRYFERGDYANAARTAGKAVQLAEDDPRGATYRQWILSLARLIPETALRFSGNSAQATPDGFVVVRRGKRSQVWDLERGTLVWEDDHHIASYFGAGTRSRTFLAIIDPILPDGKFGPIRLLIATVGTKPFVATFTGIDPNAVPHFESIGEDGKGTLVVVHERLLNGPDETHRVWALDKATQQITLISTAAHATVAQDAVFASTAPNKVCRTMLPSDTAQKCVELTEGRRVRELRASPDGRVVAIITHDAATTVAPVSDPTEAPANDVGSSLGIWDVSTGEIAWRRIASEAHSLLDVSAAGLVLYKTRSGRDEHVRMSTQDADVELIEGVDPSARIGSDHIAVLTWRYNLPVVATWSFTGEQLRRTEFRARTSLAISTDANSVIEIRDDVASRYNLAPPAPQEIPTLEEQKVHAPMMWRDDCGQLVWIPAPSQTVKYMPQLIIGVTNVRTKGLARDDLLLPRNLTGPRSLFLGSDGAIGVLTENILGIVRPGNNEIVPLPLDHDWHSAAFTSPTRVSLLGIARSEVSSYELDDWSVIDFDLTTRKVVSLCKHTDKQRPLGIASSGSHYMLERIADNDDLYYDTYSTSCKRQSEKRIDDPISARVELELRRDARHASADDEVVVVNRDGSRALYGRALFDVKSDELVAWDIFPDSHAAPVTACIASNGEIAMINEAAELHRAQLPSNAPYLAQIVTVLSSASRGSKGAAEKWFEDQRALRRMLEAAQATDPYARALLRSWGTLMRPPETERKVGNVHRPGRSRTGW